MSVVIRLLYWLPALVWASVIFLLSSIPNLAFTYGSADFFLRKISHVLVYMVLCVTVFLGLQQTTRLTLSRPVAIRAFLISLLYAIFDEVHQSMVPTRHGVVTDVAINSLGIGLGLAVVGWLEWWRQVTKPPQYEQIWQGGEVFVTLSQLPYFTTRLAQTLQPGQVLALHGDLGAGKTTLVSHLAKAFGIPKKISSPTYTISKQYPLPSGQTLYHYDWYRLSDSREVEQLGITEVIERADGIIIIEWPDRAPELLPDQTMHLYLDYVDQQTRKITINR